MLPQGIMEYNLSPREIEVLEELTKGKTNHEMANSLLISEKTIKFHLNNIFVKMNVTHRGAAWVKYEKYKKQLPKYKSNSRPNLYRGT